MNVGNTRFKYLLALKSYAMQDAAEETQTR